MTWAVKSSDHTDRNIYLNRRKPDPDQPSPQLSYLPPRSVKWQPFHTSGLQLHSWRVASDQEKRLCITKLSCLRFDGCGGVVLCFSDVSGLLRSASVLR
ncbi:hypothetical protein AAFF_G00226750 [Aldrovandia affinis]|uniref:Uncharacterized protein n=1 Tax=Aldrovandia affinis TaxID=143900 RepID=A0AAD7TBY2_9TELE|nr:hypothetical protein AAFF_G00226750 [Aldrovandia affinis]